MRLFHYISTCFRVFAHVLCINLEVQNGVISDLKLFMFSNFYVRFTWLALHIHIVLAYVVASVSDAIVRSGIFFFC